MEGTYVALLPLLPPPLLPIERRLHQRTVGATSDPHINPERSFFRSCVGNTHPCVLGPDSAPGGGLQAGLRIIVFLIDHSPAPTNVKTAKSA